MNLLLLKAETCEGSGRLKWRRRGIVEDVRCFVLRSVIQGSVEIEERSMLHVLFVVCVDQHIFF